MKKRIRVLHVLTNLGLGGTAKTMQLFVSHLDHSVFAPAVWAPQAGPRGEALKQRGIPVITGVPLDSAAMRFAPDIVHVHRAGWAEPSLLRPLRAAFRKDPERRVDRLPRVVETNIFGRHDPSASGKMIDVTLFVSHFCAERLRVVERRRIEPPRFQVLYNPVDTDAFAALTPDPARRDYAKPVFGRISRADPGKWSPLALECLPLVRAVMPDFLFLVVGGTPEAEAWVRGHHLEKNVYFLPPVLEDAELAAFFNRISFLAHANSTGESFGLVIAEGMAAGLPVITHNSPDWKDNAQVELVLNGVTGLVADTPERYAEAILALLRQPDLCRSMGEQGRARAQALFRAQDIARRLGEIYMDLLRI